MAQPNLAKLAVRLKVIDDFLEKYNEDHVYMPETATLMECQKGKVTLGELRLIQDSYRELIA